MGLRQWIVVVTNESPTKGPEWVDLAYHVLIHPAYMESSSLFILCKLRWAIDDNYATPPPIFMTAFGPGAD